MNLIQTINSLPEIARDYIYYINTIKNRREQTIYSYCGDLRLFFRFLVQQSSPDELEPHVLGARVKELGIPELKKVTLTTIHEFLHFLKAEHGDEAKALNRKISALRGFFGYLCEKMELLEKNPTKALESPAIKPALPKYLTLEQSKALLAAAKAGSLPEKASDENAPSPPREGSKTPQRDYCIVLLFLSCGLRLSELCGLNVDNLGREEITIKGKGGKERSIYLSDSCRASLEEYISHERKGYKKDVDKNALFIRPATGLRLGARGIELLLERLLAAAGLSGMGFSPHKLRHTAATLMYVHGNVDIRALQDVLGHATLATTQIYTHVASSQVKDALMSNPLANM